MKNKERKESRHTRLGHLWERIGPSRPARPHCAGHPSGTGGHLQDEFWPVTQPSHLTVWALARGHIPQGAALVRPSFPRGHLSVETWPLPHRTPALTPQMNSSDSDGEGGPQLDAAGQALPVCSAMLRSMGWPCFSIPGSQGLYLLFPSGHILPILAVSEALEGLGVQKSSSALVAGLQANGHMEQTEAGLLAVHRAPGPAGGFGGLWPLRRAQGICGTGQLREHSLPGSRCLPRVKEASRAAPGPQCPSSLPASCPWELRRRPSLQPGARQGGGRERMCSNKNWVQMGKPIGLKGQTSAVQHPKMRSCAFASLAAPLRWGGWGPPSRTPYPHPTREPKGTHRHHPKLQFPRSNKTFTWSPVKPISGKTMQKPWV